jgi:AraC-like DNA-binding protein
MQGAPVTFTVEGGRACLAYRPEGIEATAARHHVESTAVIGHRLLRRLAGPGWRAREVHFRHPRPADAREHARLFEAPLRFGQPRNALVFDEAALEARVRGADPWLLPIVEDHLRQQMAVPDPVASWPQAVRDRVARSMAEGQATVRAISRGLGLSVRTFQRRLAEHGLVFKQMVDEVRHELALRYLGDAGATLTDVALRLGYSELSAFDRAFRRWTGESPLEHRRRARAVGPA